jgi:hypothetical protein
MSGARISTQHPKWQPCCEFEATLKGEYCGHTGEVSLDGLLLCNRHARQFRLEEQVTYWRAILAHIELWSGYALTRGREDIVGLLGTERTRALAALGHVLEALKRDEGDAGSGNGRDGDGKKGGDGRVIYLWP